MWNRKRSVLATGRQEEVETGGREEGEVFGEGTESGRQRRKRARRKGRGGNGGGREG